ncbi:MAG: shikimate kinase [Lewinellaceae bacterium]|nr:shikimate kinase [Lewinellaceae bacterium]
MTGHVFLIGFMGSGKTRWGRAVARAVSRPFIDLDERIETKEGKSIAEIFSIAGESGFRVLEQQYLRRLGGIEPCVVATGGGTPCFSDNLEWMQGEGTVIYLKTAPEILVQRLKTETHKRPLLAGHAESELPAIIQARLEARTPDYERADYVVEYRGDDDVFLQQLLDIARTTF